MEPREEDVEKWKRGELDLAQLQKEINAALPRFTGKMDRYHLQDLSQSLKKLLDIKAK